MFFFAISNLSQIICAGHTASTAFDCALCRESITHEQIDSISFRLRGALCIDPSGSSRRQVVLHCWTSSQGACLCKWCISAGSTFPDGGPSQRLRTTWLRLASGVLSGCETKGWLEMGHRLAGRNGKCAQEQHKFQETALSDWERVSCLGNEGVCPSYGKWLGSESWRVTRNGRPTDKHDPGWKNASTSWSILMKFLKVTFLLCCLWCFFPVAVCTAQT